MGRCEGPQSVYNGRPEPGGGCHGEPHLLSPLPALYGSLRFKGAFFFQQFRHTFCPYHRHRGGYVSEFEACAFLGNGFSKKYSFLCIGCVLRNTKYFMQKNEQKYASINPFHMNSQVCLRIHDNGLTLISGRPTEKALQLWPCQSVLVILLPPHQFHHHAPQPELMREGQFHLT